MTAEEFLKNSNSLLLKFLNKPIGQKELKKSMVEFAKYHVEKALKAASEKVIDTHSNLNNNRVLNAYSLENIK